MANGTVGTDAEFWKVIFDGSDTTIRVGKYRTAMIRFPVDESGRLGTTGNRWVCLGDEASHPHPDAMFKNLQEAIDWMIEQQYVAFDGSLYGDNPSTSDDCTKNA